MDESDFDYENFEEISLMGDIIDKIEANDVWNETINEMIRRGDAVRRSDGKVIFSDQVPDFDIVEDIASYTQSDIKSAEEYERAMAESECSWCKKKSAKVRDVEYGGGGSICPNCHYAYRKLGYNPHKPQHPFKKSAEHKKEMWEAETFEAKVGTPRTRVWVETAVKDYEGFYVDTYKHGIAVLEHPRHSKVYQNGKLLKTYRGDGHYISATSHARDLEWNYKPKTAFAETFEAPLVGAGATMDITKDSSLSSFTPEELTGSSAIHGDFDHASLNYSGHQNIEARAEWDYAHDSGATVPKYYQDDEELPIYKYFMDSATAPYHIHGLDTFYMPEGKDYYWNKIKEKFMPADYRPDESEEWRDIHWQEEADWDAILNEEFVDELYEKWLANHEYDAVAKIAENDPDWAIQNEARLEAVGYFAESSIQKAEETFGLVQPNFWMNYPITGMLAMVGLFAIGKTLLNSRKEEM